MIQYRFLSAKDLSWGSYSPERVAKPEVILSITMAIRAITKPASRLSPNSAFRICVSTSHPMSSVPPIMEAMITMLSEAIVA